MNNVEGIRGECRRLTSAELGEMIRMLRACFGWKRAVLASKANVNEKTVERAEAGQGINEESSRRIARAFGLAEDAFVREEYFPPPDEVERSRTRLYEERRHYCEFVVTELKGARDVLSLFQADMGFAGDRQVAEQDMLAFAELKQSFFSCGAAASATGEPGLVEASQRFLAEARGFEKRGYVLKSGVAQGFFTDETPYSAALLVACKKPKGTVGTTYFDNHVWVRLPKPVLF